MKKIILLFLLIISLFTTGCFGETKTINYQNLFKITKEAVSLPLKLETLKDAIRASFEDKKYIHTLELLNEYISLSSIDEVYKDQDLIYILGSVYLFLGKHSEFYDVSNIILDKYPSNILLINLSLNALFLDSQGTSFVSILDLPIYSKAEKDFLKLWASTSPKISDLQKISRCSQSIDSKVCKIVEGTLDILKTAKSFRDEPSVYQYTLLSKNYLENGFFGLAYRVSREFIPDESNYRDGLLIKGLSQMAVGVFSQANLSFEKAYLIDPGYRNTLILYVESLYKTGDYEKCIEIGKLLLGYETYTIEVRKYIIESLLLLKDFSGLKDFLRSQVENYYNELGRDEFLTILLISNKQDFMQMKDFWNKVFSESEVELWYKTLSGRVPVEFFEKNFGELKDISFLTKIAWIELLYERERIDDANIIKEKLISNNDSRILRIVLKYFEERVDFN